VKRFIFFLGFLAVAAFSQRADDPVVFKSDVALSRVDAQVVDRDGRSVSGLGVRDFVLRVDGKITPIKNFDSESMPMDILFLLDVSGSMRPHVERMADAAASALRVLSNQDRVAIEVFDTMTRERLPFTNDRNAVNSELRHLVRWEGFNGGTRITSAMISAANYVQRHARPDARRAIVILTDDETQDGENEPRVEAALSKAGAVLSFLEAPYDPPSISQRSPIPSGPRVPWPGGGWPGSGGGGIPGGGTSMPGPMDQSHSAGTETIAHDSGGDAMPINDSSSLQDTLNRLRQRYALHFYLADDSIAKSQHDIRVDLSTEARILYPNAEVRSRRIFMGGTNQTSGPTVVSHQTAITDPIPGEEDVHLRPEAKRKRVAVNEDEAGPAGSTVGPPSEDDAAPAASTAPTATPTAQTAPAQTAPKGGWPKADPNAPKP
jgi:hypothetical protein